MTTAAALTQADLPIGTEVRKGSGTALYVVVAHDASAYGQVQVKLASTANRATRGGWVAPRNLTLAK